MEIFFFFLKKWLTELWLTELEHRLSEREKTNSLHLVCFQNVFVITSYLFLKMCYFWKVVNWIDTDILSKLCDNCAWIMVNKLWKIFYTFFFNRLFCYRAATSPAVTWLGLPGPNVQYRREAEKQRGRIACRPKYQTDWISIKGPFTLCVCVLLWSFPPESLTTALTTMLKCSHKRRRML